MPIDVKCAPSVEHALGVQCVIGVKCALEWSAPLAYSMYTDRIYTHAPYHYYAPEPSTRDVFVGTTSYSRVIADF